MDLKGCLWPIGDYPNLLGITPADRRPKLEEYNIDFGDSFGEKTVYIKTPMRKEDFNVDGFEEFDIRKNLFKQLFDKVKLKPPTFEEFCKGVRLNVMYNPAIFCRTYNLIYFNNEVGNIIANIAVSEIDLIDERVHAEDIQNAIEEKKLSMYTKLTQEYDKKNKEATIKEEKNMPISMYYCDEIREYLGLPAKTPEKKSKWIEGLPAVKKVETYNQRVVKVTFIDGTFTKSVCSENDHFDIDVGITICLMKRLIGTNSDNATREYNRLMNNVHAVMEKNEKEKLAAQGQKAAEKAKKRKAELKRAAKKLKAKEEQIDIQKQAIIRAHQEMEGLEQ